MPKLNLVQAITDALKETMAADDRVMVLGEDVGLNGGVFRATDGLLDEFGEDRVVDTPLAELGIVGTSIGLAVAGMRPVPEMQFSGFSYPAFNQITSHVARIRNRSRGAFTCPMVVRMPYGGGIHAPEHHSESPEVYYAHTPGLKVVMPGTPYDAKGLLISSIEDDDPVIYLEPKRSYRAFKEEVPEGLYRVPIGKANVRREGSDLTLIGWGAMVPVCESAAEQAAAQGIDVEFIDLRTISPMDTATILESVKKTGRAVVAHEAPKTFGPAAEIIATINDEALLWLEAPVGRVTGYDIPMPLYARENYYLPGDDRVLASILETARF